MSKKQTLSKYCRIFQWIEEQDAKFAEAIRDLCLEGALSPGGRVAGVTFLMPSKAIRESITEMAYSDTPEEAVTMIEALIIPDILAEANKFGTHPVGNRIGIKFEDVKVEGRNVTFKGDKKTVKLTPSDFKPLTTRADRIAVWLADEMPPTKGSKTYQPPMPVRSKLGGASDTTTMMTTNRRMTMATTVEVEFDSNMRLDKCVSCNPYLAKVVSFLNWAKMKHTEILTTVMPFLDYSPIISFYLLFEPYKTTGEFIVSEDLLAEWGGADLYGNAAQEYTEFFATMSRPNVMSQIDSIRQQLMGNTNGLGLPQAVHNVYKALSEHNTINGGEQVLPESTAHALQGYKKQWQDEFRFTFFEALQEVCNGPYNSHTFHSIVTDIRNTRPGNDYMKEICLGNLLDFQTSVDKNHRSAMLLVFIKSTAFLYWPVPANLVGVNTGSMAPDNGMIYNINAIALDKLRKCAMQRTGLSQQAMFEMQKYIASHGGVDSLKALLEHS